MVAVDLGPDGEAAFTDRGIRAGHDYHYRVAVVVDTTGLTVPEVVEAVAVLAEARVRTTHKGHE